MKLSKADYIKISILTIVTALFLFANFYAVRRIISYGAQAYLYDKLLVAYQVSGRSGLHKELNRVLAEEKGTYMLKLARGFEGQLAEIKHPAEFLENKVKENRARVNLMRGLRTGAFTVIFTLFLLRLFLNRKDRKNE